LSLDRRIFIIEQDLIVWSDLLIRFIESVLQGGSSHRVAAFGKVDLAVKNMLTRPTRHGLAASLGCDLNLGKRAMG